MEFPHGSVRGFCKGPEHCEHCTRRTSCRASSEGLRGRRVGEVFALCFESIVLEDVRANIWELRSLWGSDMNDGLPSGLPLDCPSDVLSSSSSPPPYSIAA